MKKISIILLLVLSLCFPVTIFAETITLKSGKTVEGKILEKTEPGLEQKDNSYFNSDFGVKILTPIGWYLQDMSEALQKMQSEPKSFGIIFTKDRNNQYNPTGKDIPPLPNIQFYGFKMPGISAEAQASGTINLWKHKPSVEFLGEEKIQINGREWIMLNMLEHMKDGSSIRGTVYFYAEGEKGIVYTYQVTSKKEEFDLYKEDFDKTLKNIEFLE